MLLKDLDKQLKMTQVIDPKAYATGDSPVNSTSVNRATMGSGSVAFLFNVGAVVSAGLFALKLQDSADDSSYADVAAADYSTALVATAAATKQETAYLGTKQYVRAVLTYTSGTSVVIGVTAVEARGTLPA